MSDAATDPTNPLYRWWDKPPHKMVNCTRGFDFHAMGSTPRGRHALDQPPPAPTQDRENPTPPSDSR